LTVSASVATPASLPRSQLLRVLGIAFGIAIIIGNTIIVGILRTPGEVAAHLPSQGAFLAAWLVGGLYALLGAASLAELGAMIPRSGGQYVLVHRALGPYPGFIVGWSDWISTCGTIAAGGLVMGEYLGVLVPAVTRHAAMVGCTAAIVIAAFQWRGIRWGDRAQQVLSVAKALALFALVIAAFSLGSPPAPPAPRLALTGFAAFSAAMVALQGVIYTYDGWNGVLYFGEEVVDPGRNVPRSMIGGVLLVIGIYLLLNLAFLHVLPYSRLAGEPFVAGAAAATIFGSRGDQVIRAIMVVSVLGGINACLLMAPRVPLAMARDGLLPKRLTEVNPGGTPTIASLLSTSIAIGFMVTGTFNRVLALLAFFFVANYSLSLVSVFVLRRTEPDTPRPYRAWGHPWTTGLALAGYLAFLVGQVLGDTRNSLWSLGLLALSWPVFRWVRRRDKAVRSKE
jgi:basic amino acid/polyamine antiporter, APA family